MLGQGSFAKSISMGKVDDWLCSKGDNNLFNNQI